METSANHLTPEPMADRGGEGGLCADFSKNVELTVEDLQCIITAPANGMYRLPSTAYNEVFDGIIIGEASIALDEANLQRLKVTHVLNAAYGQKKFMHVNTGPDYYKSGIVYQGIEATDIAGFKIMSYFDESCNFIAQAVGTKESGKRGGKILVHCREGVSRSSTLVLAYLIRYQDMSLKEALTHVRSKREISPNAGFLKQLIQFSTKLGRCY